MKDNQFMRIIVCVLIILFLFLLLRNAMRKEGYLTDLKVGDWDLQGDTNILNVSGPTGKTLTVNNDLWVNGTINGLHQFYNPDANTTYVDFKGALVFRNEKNENMLIITQDGDVQIPGRINGNLNINGDINIKNIWSIFNDQNNALVFFANGKNGGWIGNNRTYGPL